MALYIVAAMSLDGEFKFNMVNGTTLHGTFHFGMVYAFTSKDFTNKYCVAWNVFIVSEYFFTPNNSVNLIAYKFSGVQAPSLGSNARASS